MDVDRQAVGIKILPAGLEQLDLLLTMMLELQSDDPWEELFDLPELRTNLKRLLAEPTNGLAFMAWDQDQPVGYLIICFDYSLEYRGKGAWVDELFVRRARRGQGIGTQLLDLAEDACRRAGARVLHLEVNHGNPAQKLYRRRGFTEHARFLMTKRLDR